MANNSFEMVTLLLNNGANPKMVDKENQTPLHIAALLPFSETRLEIFDLLLKKGVDPNAIDSFGRTVLYNAIINKADDVVKRLFDEDRSLQQELVNSKENTMGITPLHLTAFLNLDKLSEMLIARKAKVDAPDHNGETPLNYAASQNAIDVAKRLVKEGAKTNFKNGKWKSRTPLHIAAASGAQDVGKLLIGENKTSIHAVDDLGLTPLHYAKLFKQADFAKFLQVTETKMVRRRKKTQLPLPKKSKNLSPDDIEWLSHQLRNTLPITFPIPVTKFQLPSANTVISPSLDIKIEITQKILMVN